MTNAREQTMITSKPLMVTPPKNTHSFSFAYHPPPPIEATHFLRQFHLLHIALMLLLCPLTTPIYSKRHGFEKHCTGLKATTLSQSTQDGVGPRLVFTHPWSSQEPRSANSHSLWLWRRGPQITDNHALEIYRFSSVPTQIQLPSISDGYNDITCYMTIQYKLQDMISPPHTYFYQTSTYWHLPPCFSLECCNLFFTRD